MLVPFLLLAEEVTLVAGEGLLHRVLDVRVLQATVRVDLTRTHKVRVVTCQVVVGDTAFQGVRIVVRVVAGLVLPAWLELGRRGLKVTVEVVLQVLSQLCSLAFHLFTISEGEEIRTVIKELLPVSILLIPLFKTLISIIAYKLIAFAHQ